MNTPDPSLADHYPEETIGGCPDLTRADLAGAVVIRVLEEWRPGRGLYWRARGWGYTSDLALAGLFKAGAYGLRKYKDGKPTGYAEEVPIRDLVTPG